MPRYALLLRGINVGGHGKLPMAELKAVLAELGCTEVATYLQSGNAAVTSPVRSAGKLAAEIADALAATRDRPIAVLARTSAQIDTVVSANPYPDRAADNPKMLHVAFLDGTPTRAAAQAIADQDYAPDDCTLDGDTLYLCFAKSSYDSTMATDALKRAKVTATSRNWNTVLAVQKMLRG